MPTTSVITGRTQEIGLESRGGCRSNRAAPTPSKLAFDEGAAARLWAWTEDRALAEEVGR